MLAGAYTLRPAAKPAVCIATMGALVTEALAAADRLAEMGVEAEVICVTSPDLLYRAVRARDGLAVGQSAILDQVFPPDRAASMVTVLDGHPHTLAFLATINRVQCKSLGVSEFGQVGDLDSVYRHHGIDTDSIIRAALDVC